MRPYFCLLLGLLSCGGVHTQVAAHLDRAGDLAAAGSWAESQAEFAKACDLKTDPEERAGCRAKLQTIYASRTVARAPAEQTPVKPRVAVQPTPSATPLQTLASTPPPPVVGSPPPTASAAPTPAVASAFVPGSPQPTAFAFVVGVERYDGLPAPTGARADAEQMARMFRLTLGIPESHIQKLLDDKATKGAIESRIEWLRTSVPPGGRVYFYYSGHGAPDSSTGNAFIVPSDGDPKFLKQTGLLLTDVVARLSSSQAKEVVILVDSCFSGVGGRSVLPPGERPLVRVKEVTPVANVAVYTAARGSEVSGPTSDGQSGLFSSYVLRGLGQAEADADGDGQVSLQELDAWVGPRVTRDASRANRVQTPGLVLGSRLGNGSTLIVAWGLPSK